MTVLPLTNNDWANGTLAAKLARADLAWGGPTSDDSDSVQYLQSLPYLPTDDRTQLDRIAKLASPEREARAAALAAKLEKEAIYAVYEHEAIPELVSPRLGCIIQQPEYTGIDLAALCLRRTSN